MVSESVWDELNRSYGFEITLILLSGPFSRREILEKIPYEISQTRIERVLEWGYDKSIFEVAGTRGVDKYFTNENKFSAEQIASLNRRALLRIMDPIEGKVKPNTLDDLPDEFFYAYDRSEVEESSNGLIFDKSTPEKTELYEIFYDNRDMSTQAEGSYGHANSSHRESLFPGDPDPEFGDEE